MSGRLVHPPPLKGPGSQLPFKTAEYFGKRSKSSKYIFDLSAIVISACARDPGGLCTWRRDGTGDLIALQQQRHIRKNRQNSVEMGCRHFGVIRSPSPFSPSMVARVARVADAPGIAPVQSWQRYRLETFQNNNLGILSAEIIRVRGWEIIRAARPAMS